MNPPAGQSLDYLHRVKKFFGLALFILSGVVDWIDDAQTAHTCNGSAQPDKVVPVQLVRPAEAVDDFWNGPS